MKPDFAGWRHGLDLSQTHAGAVFGVCLKTWQNWEQGRRESAPAQVLLEVLQTWPMVAAELLRKLKGEEK